MIYVINVTIFQERFSCRQTYIEIDCTLDQEKENQSGRLWSSTFTSRRVKKHIPQPAFLRFVQPFDKLLNSRKARKKKKAVESLRANSSRHQDMVYLSICRSQLRGAFR